MKKFIISESEKSHIKNLYNIKEVDAEKVVSSLFTKAKEIAQRLETQPQTGSETSQQSQIGSGTEQQSQVGSLETTSSIGEKDKLYSPLKNTTFPTGNFGVLRDLDIKYAKLHNTKPVPHQGIDLPASSGTELFAPGDGTVEAAEFSKGGCGGKIRIKHTNGLVSSFCHLSGIFVKSGNQVKLGDKIGLTGGDPNTVGAGYSTKAHLHWETRINGVVVDPLKYVIQKFYDKNSTTV
jgi:murein DD-endopeptidase MepM/ murein hydrolase activator NlpD